ncbi:MAG TPA: Gfo/Idh/MocA family oxidoreductase [Methylomirabilota bacterium]|nr:Gfo/Idh/MocA family oxidoreductase [Methylomirabilota bacterium]
MNQENSSSTSRREFLRASGAVTAGLVAAPFVLTGRSAELSPGDAIRVGLVGCGGRGSGAAMQALNADGNAQLVAAADVFENSLQRGLIEIKRAAEKVESAHKVKVEPDKCFVGLDAYQKVIDSGVDLVILATPPGFRPQHLAAAVAAGKHVFCEKPMATDGPGVRSVLASVEEAKRKNLAVVAGFCWRYDTARREFFKRLHDGAIGDIRAMYHTYYTGPVKPMPPASSRKEGMSDVEWQVRNWYNFGWLSGDGYTEQCVHSVDKMAWTMNDVPPLKCTAVGGRQTQNNEGNIYDHIEVNYEFAHGVRGFVVHRQIPNCHSENKDFILGSKGNGNIGGRRSAVEFTDSKGELQWRSGAAPKDMYQVEHDELFASIRNGKPINDGVRMATSTLMGLMGRMAAYSGQEITWEQAMNSQERLVPENLTWDMPLPIAPMPVPGKTKFI